MSIWKRFLNPAWDDVAIGLGQIKQRSANYPDWHSYKGGEVLRFRNGNDESVSFATQLPHKYKLGSNIEFHVHLTFTDGNAGNVHWNFTYSWGSIGDTMPAETTVSTDLASSGVADKHTIHSIADTILGTGKDISSILLCSLERESTNAGDTYVNDVYLMSADFHIPMDTIGSRLQWVK